MFVFALYALIPIVFLFLKNRLVGYFCSSILGSILLVSNMLILESKATDSDFDVVFLFSIFLWVFITFFVYALFYFLFGFLNKAISKKEN